MMECLSCIAYLLLSLLIAALILYAAHNIYSKISQKNVLALFSNTEKDKVIIHCFPKISVRIHTVVPWDLKIEMFCRMANIKYEKDSKNPFGPKGKTPWISINGTHIGDSQLILENLRQKFDLDFNRKYSSEQLAVARAVRVMLEERWYWAMVMWRWLRKNGEEQFYKDFERLGRESSTPLWITRIYFRRILFNQVKAHGIGRHTEEEAVQMHLGDLRTVSQILGSKKYILGDEPCEDDCAIFGQVAQAVWGLPNSPFEKFVQEEAPNLKDYCIRIKEKFWKNEWDDK